MSTVTQTESKYVFFRLNAEYYALDVQNVIQVFTPSSITAIPQSDAHISGVINYRGEVTSVIDLKKRLSIPQKVSKATEELDEEERLYVIIVKHGASVVGLLVDYVEAVVSISSDKVQSALELISGQEKTGFLEGVARTEFGLTIIISLDIILSNYETLDTSQLEKLRESMMKDEEIVIQPSTFLDDDDIDEYQRSSAKAPSFKKVDGSAVDSSPLNLNELTKSELIKIAIEMNISNVSTRTTKAEIINKINEYLGE